MIEGWLTLLVTDRQTKNTVLYPPPVVHASGTGQLQAIPPVAGVRLSPWEIRMKSGNQDGV